MNDAPAISRSPSAAHDYFRHLNYTLGNEDTSVELAALPERARHVMVVAGCGGRVLPLLARSPARVTCVDVAREQLWLTELRVATLRAFERPAFLAFWGYPPRDATPLERRALFARIALSGEARSFARALLEDRGWTAPIYAGRWERTFAALARVNRAITGAAGATIFEARTLEEQRAIVRERFPRARWRMVLALLGNAAVFNAALYHGDFPRKNIAASHARFYRETFDRLFATTLARESFFLELLFFGRIVHPEACPIECAPDVFARAKAALATTEIVYAQADVLAAAATASPPVDFLSLSDVPSYWPPSFDRGYLQRIRDGLAPGAIVVTRAYLRVPADVDTTGFTDVTSRFADTIAREKVGVYAIAVHRRDGATPS